MGCSQGAPPSSPPPPPAAWSCPPAHLARILGGLSGGWAGGLFADVQHLPLPQDPLLLLFRCSGQEKEGGMGLNT